MPEGRAHVPRQMSYPLEQSDPPVSRPAGTLPARQEAEACHCDPMANGAGIRFMYDESGGIWTTMDALNEALGLVGATPHLEPYDPDDF